VVIGALAVGRHPAFIFLFDGRVCTENRIRLDGAMEAPKLAE
jgi:hypothetical protein